MAAKCVLQFFFSLLGGLLFFIFFSMTAFAASITLSGGSAQLGSINDEYIIHVSLSINVTDGTTYYLRGVFYKQGTSDYCGYTWNGATWFNGPYTANEGWKNFLAVPITNNTWNGDLKAKLDTSDSGCKDSGNYGFKVERFTSTSSSGNFDSQNEQALSIVIPTSTPTPTVTPQPTDTPKVPTPTRVPTPTKIPTSVPTSNSSSSTSTPTSMTATVKPSLTLFPSLTKAATSGSVLSASSVSATATPFPTKKPPIVRNTTVFGIDQDMFANLAIFAGFGLILVSCGILAYRKYRPWILEKFI